MTRSTAAGVVLCVLIGFAMLPFADIARADPERWLPPAPDAKQGDWIRLNSGEWLWGEVKGLRDKDLEFDSDELDLLKLDWDDVAELRSARILTYRFEDLGRFTGTAVMRDGTVAIQVGDQVKELPRESLLVILEGKPSELNFWSAKMSLGWVGRSGNTNQVDLNALIDVRRITTRSRVNMKYTGNIGSVQSEENINNHNALLSYDVLVTAGFFVTPVAFNYFKDRFQNINYRTTIGAAAGYAILRGGDVDWDLSMGAGYQNTKFVSVPEGEDDSEGTGAVIPSTKLEWDITGNVEFGFDYIAQISVPEIKNTVHHASWLLSVDIVGDILDFDVSLVWDRVETPREDAEGNVPKRDDLRTAFGIGVDL
jgi:putative salt-induced outer membrane protein YdiY